MNHKREEFILLRKRNSRTIGIRLFLEKGNKLLKYSYVLHNDTWVRMDGGVNCVISGHHFSLHN
jgi:hypothetical protein